MPCSECERVGFSIGKVKHTYGHFPHVYAYVVGTNDLLIPIWKHEHV